MPKNPEIDSSEVRAQPENDRPKRRRWTKEEKLRILREAEACEERGQLGELLRREGIYGSLLHGWRRQFAEGGEEALEGKRVGRPKKDPKDVEIERLKKRERDLMKRLELANVLLDFQKKANELMGIAIPEDQDSSSEK